MNSLIWPLTVLINISIESRLKLVWAEIPYMRRSITHGISIYRERVDFGSMS